MKSRSDLLIYSLSRRSLCSTYSNLANRVGVATVRLAAGFQTSFNETDPRSVAQETRQRVT